VTVLADPTSSVEDVLERALGGERISDLTLRHAAEMVTRGH